MIYQGISAHARAHVMWNQFIIVPVWTHENVSKSAHLEMGTNRFALHN